MLRASGSWATARQASNDQRAAARSSRVLRGPGGGGRRFGLSFRLGRRIGCRLGKSPWDCRVLRSLGSLGSQGVGLPNDRFSSGQHSSSPQVSVQGRARKLDQTPSSLGREQQARGEGGLKRRAVEHNPGLRQHHHQRSAFPFGAPNTGELSNRPNSGDFH